MSVAKPRPKTRRVSLGRASTSCGLALAVFLFGSKALQSAAAEGETRTISMHHVDTKEDITITYMRDGRYDEAALEKINWFLRDWRRGKETRMDPHLIDLLWQVHRETGSHEPIYIVCGYRSPPTNAMLHDRSHAVARYSQHMLGHAVDFYIPGVPLADIRVIGLRLQRGGVGFYPTSGSPFVHMDTGGVRMWPQMSRAQLLNVFPDGRTAYVPRDGHPLPGYALALADLKERGQDPKLTWDQEAHARGLDKSLVAAADAPAPLAPSGSYDDTSEAASDGTGRVAMAVSAAQGSERADDGLLHAALEREAARRRAARMLPAAAPSQSGALFEAAAFVVPAAAAEASSRNPAPQPLAAFVSPAAAAGAGQPADQLPPGLALSYAGGEEPQPQATTAQPPLPQAPAATTIAIKRTGDQPYSTIIAPPPAAGAPAFAAASPSQAQIVESNPWIDAVMVSSSIARLTALALGEPDFLALAPLVEKPAQTVIMSFSKDPNPGLAADRFSGSAVASTATYQWAQQDLALH